MIDLSPTIPSGIQNLGFGWRPPTNRFPIDQLQQLPQPFDNGAQSLVLNDPGPTNTGFNTDPHPQPVIPGGTPGPTTSPLTGGTNSGFAGAPLPPMPEPGLNGTGGMPPVPPATAPPPMINPIPGLTGGQPPLTFPGTGGTPTGGSGPAFLGPPIRPDNPQGFGWRRRG